MDPTTAATIASRHGLSLADAAAIARMCDTADEAERVAAAFVTPPAGHPDAPAPTTTGEAFAEFFTASMGAPAAADIYSAIATDDQEDNTDDHQH